MLELKKLCFLRKTVKWLKINYVVKYSSTKKELKFKLNIMFSKHTKFQNVLGTGFLQKSVTIYKFLWFPIFKSTKEMVDNF